LFHPRRAVTISHTNLHHRVDFTPYEGRKVTGWPVTTILRGEVLVRDGVLREDASRGRFLPRSARL
jgi:dihydropyrimidinase